jgi:hypothetical protein
MGPYGAREEKTAPQDALPKPANKNQLISKDDAKKYLQSHGNNMDEAMKAAEADGWRVR